MWSALLGAGISALGSIFGKDDDEKKVTSTVDYKKMAREAEAAGFNPLTVLRNGGSAGFTTTHHPALSAKAGFGEAFQTIGNALMSFDARADERAELEQQLLKAQIDQINRSGGASKRLWSMDVPVGAGSTISLKPGVSGAGSGVAAPLTSTYTDEFGNRLRGPHVDAPDIDQILTAPALRLSNTWQDFWDKNYGRGTEDYTQRTWKLLTRPAPGGSTNENFMPY